MDVEKLISRLGYSDNDHFLRADADEFTGAPEHGHIFRHAADDLPKRLNQEAELLGVYTLSAERISSKKSRVPLVYVCRAQSDAATRDIHRLVWCQDVVPFVLVHTPRGLVLHSGFWYERSKQGGDRGVLQPLRAFNECHALIEEFGAESIDSGRFWQTRRSQVKPEKRVDWKLLTNLEQLDQRLRSTKMKLSRETAHALIGKYVFLHYLRDRGILSPQKLKSWGLTNEDVFGQKVTLNGLRTCVERLEDWLNGGVFPIAWAGKESPKPEHIRIVASVFSGDSLVGSDLRQLSFDFEAYDFSYIPIETLSVIYQQFLHAKDEEGKSRGKKQGAYYTPIPLVNLMLTALEEHKPIRKGTRILDPACGSGAFLVQAYRRLIEREYPPTAKRPTPKQLETLLTKHVFGVDADGDACSVTELSLLVTLLDQLEPPDVERLPCLRGTNVIHADFFDGSSVELSQLRAQNYDAVVGNPPWKSINSQKLDDEDIAAWQWIKDSGHATSETPVGGNQVAQAFAWKVREFMAGDAEAALLLPGMTLFENRSEHFRRQFFSTYDVHAVINFANLTEALFAGRSRVPAGAFFFRAAEKHEPDSDRFVRTYSPFIANQEANRQSGTNDRTQTWSLVINESEIRDLSQSGVATGDAIPWKLALWGSYRDLQLINKLSKRFDSLKHLESNRKLLFAAQGAELKERPVLKGVNKTKPISELCGKKVLQTEATEGYRRIFAFHPSWLRDNEHIHLRERGGEKGLKIFHAPHVIVSAARIFAVYEDDFLIVPPRQIGLVSPNDDRDFLKALSLFLSSDFAYYHQFFTSPEFGVKRDRATLKALRTIPVPITALSPNQLKEWAELLGKLSKTEPRTLDELRKKSQRKLFDDEQDSLIAELNQRVYDSLKMTERDRALVHDLVHVRLELRDGNVGHAAVRPPDTATIRRYGTRLQKELDAFVGDIIPKRHNVNIVHDDMTGMVSVELVQKSNASRRIAVWRAGTQDAKYLANTRDRLQREYSQWVYFNRDLRIYERNRTCLLKPMQSFHWTESQAMADASDIIAETMESGAGD